MNRIGNMYLSRMLFILAWDLWNEVEKMDNEDEQNEEYHKYKAEHPELYKGVYELDDYTKAMNDDEELIFAYKIKDGEFRYYRADEDKVSEEDEKKITEIIKATQSINLLIGMDIKMVRMDKHGVKIK